MLEVPFKKLLFNFIFYLILKENHLINLDKKYIKWFFTFFFKKLILLKFCLYEKQLFFNNKIFLFKNIKIKKEYSFFIFNLNCLNTNLKIINKIKLNCLILILFELFFKKINFFGGVYFFNYVPFEFEKAIIHFNQFIFKISLYVFFLCFRNIEIIWEIKYNEYIVLNLHGWFRQFYITYFYDWNIDQDSVEICFQKTFQYNLYKCRYLLYIEKNSHRLVSGNSFECSLNKIINNYSLKSYNLINNVGVLQTLFVKIGSEFVLSYLIYDSYLRLMQTQNRRKLKLLFMSRFKNFKEFILHVRNLKDAPETLSYMLLNYKKKIIYCTPYKYDFFKDFFLLNLNNNKWLNKKFDYIYTFCLETAFLNLLIRFKINLFFSKFFIRLIRYFEFWNIINLYIFFYKYYTFLSKKSLFFFVNISFSFITCWVEIDFFLWNILYCKSYLNISNYIFNYSIYEEVSKNRYLGVKNFINYFFKTQLLKNIVYNYCLFFCFRDLMFKNFKYNIWYKLFLYFLNNNQIESRWYCMYWYKLMCEYINYKTLVLAFQNSYKNLWEDISDYNYIFLS